MKSLNQWRNPFVRKIATIISVPIWLFILVPAHGIYSGIKAIIEAIGEGQDIRAAWKGDRD